MSPSSQPTPALPSDRSLRLAAAALAGLLAVLAFVLRDTINLKVQALLGIVCFVSVVAALSSSLRAVNWRTVGSGMGLQVLLALFILKLEIGGVRPGFELFSRVAGLVRRFLEFANAGSSFVFGPLANQAAMEQYFPANGFVFAFVALPAIIFVSSFFTVLYHFGILQFVVRVTARAMVRLLGTSGAETLSAVANVFLGQTEAPIIVRPYVQNMTQSELLALMVGGLATISGGMMAVYISLGADPVAILTTSVMAAPCGLYLAKIMLPETEEPETRGEVKTVVGRRHGNVIDAVAAGASDGTVLAINVAAMLIAFLAFIALLDFILGTIQPGLSLAVVFSWVFAPLAVLMGTPSADVPAIADLLGTKLAANEMVAYVKLATEYRETIDPRSHTLATYALTGFANFGSIGILLGGVGGMAPSRRADLARLGLRALFAGFMATMINASIAAVLL